MSVEVRMGRGPPARELLLEREVELDALVELFEGARGGRGGLVVLEGPAGVGKSALLGWAAGVGGERGLVVLRARGHELEQGFGWGVARSLLGAAVGSRSEAERDELLRGPAAPARVLFGNGTALGSEAGFAILHALYWLVARLGESGPLLLVVDDAQWADEPSLRFLVFLAGRLSDQPVAVVVSARSCGLGDGEVLRQLAGDPIARVLEPASLGASAVAELVRHRLAGADEELCRRCFELSAGNPLQLRALLAALEQQPQPADAVGLAAAAERAGRSLSRSVLRRLGALSPAARALARGVAVLEDDAPLHVAAALSGLAAAAALAAADELARADVLRAGDPLGFTHPLVRAAVYGELAFGERAQTHRRAARLLAQARASSERVSAHLLESSPDGDDVVVELLRASARRALAQGTPASAVRYLDRALREPPTETARPGVLAELGRAEALAGRPTASAHLEAAIDDMADSRERAALLLEFGRELHHGGRVSEASAAFGRGLEELRAGEHEGDRSELAVDLEGGYLTSAMHTPDRAADAHARADAILADQRLSSRARRALASKAMIMRLFAGAPHAEVLAVALGLFDGGRLIEEDGGDSQALTHVIGTLSWCDAYPAADRALRLAFGDARRRGSVLRFAMASQLRARQRLWTGPIADAVMDARAAVEVWRGGQQAYLHPAAYSLVCGLLEQGERAEAEAVLALGEAQPPASPFFAAWRHAAAGRVAADRGDDTAALEAFLASGRSLTELLMVNPTVLPWRSEAALSAQRLGRGELARKLIAEELALAERFGAPRAIAVARRAAGLLERGEAAVERLRSAAELLAGCGARIEHTRALIDLGAAVRRAGRSTEARGMLRKAVALADAADAAALAERARQELRLAGGRAPARSQTRGHGLTPSEHRVAELAAGGQSNRQIADALFVSAKSVEWHLGNVYRKLDIRGRGQLPAALA